MLTLFSHPYLDSLNNFEFYLNKISVKDFNLDRISVALQMLGNPQKNLKIIHVAGTKGKGSTCAMLASILAHAGFKVGLYTSPHLHRVNERIRILDKNNLRSSDDFSGSIIDEDLAKLIALVRPVAGAIESRGEFLTYFETLTIIAAKYFADKEVDFAILETGLGGRLDATNVFDSAIAVITPISLDHVNILGDTLKKIAQEKAGIIKGPKQQVVLAPQKETVMGVLKDRCQKFGIVPCVVHPMQYKQLSIALKGEHQLVNAACAFEVIRLLQEQGVVVSKEAIADGLKQVRWHGRFEIIKQKPIVIVDGAHNPASSEALAKTILDEYRSRRVILILGLSADKDIRAVCEPLNLISDMVILTKANHPRSYSFTQDEAQEIFAGKKVLIIENVKEALTVALSKADKDDVIVVTGSLFVVAEAREYRF